MESITAEPVLPEQALATFATALNGAIAAQFPGADPVPVHFEAPRRPEFGDFATNAAFALTRIAKRSPQDVATTLIACAMQGDMRLHELFSEITATAGFINLRLAPQVWQAVVRQIITQGRRFGESAPQNRRISLEFGSANPTGPLVVVQGRTCSIGATLAEAMRYCGYDVFVEWIINDAGGQLDRLGRSLYARYRQLFDPEYPFPEDGYPGEYLIPVAKLLAHRDGDRWVNVPEEQWLPHFSQFGRDMMVAEQRRTVERFGIQYDLWQSEKELHDTGRIKAGLQRLIDADHTYEQDGALFFKASDFGDDKDRVLVRRDGRPTYFANDVTYHFEKLRRADKVVDILGPDHHGYIGRLKGLAEALGFSADHLEVLIAQQITLMRGGEMSSMSKRAGQIVTLDEIIDEVGVDAARFFFVMLAPESPLTFDLELAKQQTNENPVYYVQYGHARISSVFRNADPDDVEAARQAGVDALHHPAELALIRRLADMPDTLQNVVEHLAPHRLTRYARDIASEFHQFYHECRILTDNREERLARLALCIATQTVLARVLELIGVSAPTTM
ncbi:MAG TPA: arginine--tRNA ligase [Candidatus Baltobacteraceae bacterium]|jgi:arginyl-tRNA synthetase|nr:arginine--tRNA ligase [Candidatus Baltobacteraceae bacterium]